MSTDQQETYQLAALQPDKLKSSFNLKKKLLYSNFKSKKLDLIF
jgi:hypothetical protein